MEIDARDERDLLPRQKTCIAVKRQRSRPHTWWHENFHVDNLARPIVSGGEHNSMGGTVPDGYGFANIAAGVRSER